MWSSFMENNNPCINTPIRNGLHDFDFANPIRVDVKVDSNIALSKIE
jgi:hypothetical protein